MKGFRCDRCEKWFLDDHGCYVELWEPAGSECERPNTHMDLCSDCKRSLLDWHQNAKDKPSDIPDFIKGVNPTELLHKLWTKAVDTPNYEKAEWRQLEAILNLRGCWRVEDL